METLNNRFRQEATDKVDRVFVLKQKEGKVPESTTGMVDRRLFTGNNALHATWNPMDCLWSLHYEDGSLPQALKSKFTKFSTLKSYVEMYFNKRNVDVVAIK